MSAERLRRVNALFDAALELPGAEREAFLLRQCDGDAALHAEVTRLLALDENLAGSATQSAVGVFNLGLEAAASEDAQRQSFGPYRLEEEIGRGGMGRVFRARRVDGVVEQTVAIKLVRRELLHPALLRRFSTERQVLAALDHPGISRLIDAGETPDGTPYVVMELVRGEPLLEYCDRRKLGVEQRLELFRRMLDAVAHAHRNLVVHRDLKPGNVLVTPEGQPKLLDFGIAKPLEAGVVAATATADRFFTPAYAAPEQLRGGPITVGCDVYALGALLFELLTGRPPFQTEGCTAGEIERLILSVPPPAMSATIAAADAEQAQQRGAKDARQWRRQLGGDLEAIVQRTLRKETRARYATVEQLDADVLAFLQRRPVAASGVQFTYRLRKFIGRHRVAVGLAAFATTSLIGGALLLALQNIALVHERDRARLTTDLLQQAFLAADPAQKTGGDVSARLILDQARSGLEPLSDARPLLYAELGNMIADVQVALGLSPEAAELARRATDAARRGGADTASIYRLLVLQGRALASAGQVEAAQARLEEASALVPTPSAEWLLARSRVLRLQSKGSDSLPLLRQAHAAIAALPPTDDLATRVRWQQAEAHKANKEYERSLALLDETLAWQRAGLPAGHARELLTRIRRVDALRHLKRFEEALQEAAPTAQAVESLYGAETPFTAYARSVYGSALADLDQPAAAAEEYRAAMKAWRASLGPAHPNTITTTFNLAYTLTDMTPPPPDTEPLFRAVLADALTRFGPRSYKSVVFRIGYADFLLESGRADQALQLLLETDGMAGMKSASPAHKDAYRERLTSASRAAGCVETARAPTAACMEVTQLLAARSR